MSNETQPGKNALAVIAAIKEGATSLDMLEEDDKAALVEQLRWVEGEKVITIAEKLGVTIRTIYRYLEHGRKIRGREVQAPALDAVAEETRSKVEINYAAAVRNGDPVGAMSIWFKYLDKLQSFGMLPKIAEAIRILPATAEEEAAELKRLDAEVLRAEKLLEADFIVTDDAGPGASPGTNGTSHSPESGSE